MVDANVSNWLQSRSRKLASLESDSPSADLVKCRAAWDDVEILALGESTHGTREFFTLKHRIIEFLVSEGRLRVLAFEASESAAVTIDDIIRSDRPEAGESLVHALAGLRFWTWQTYELLELLEWIRLHNSSRPTGDRVRFVGVDPQHPETAARVVEKYLATVNPNALTEFAETLQMLRTPRKPDQPPLCSSVLERCNAVHAVIASSDGPPEERERALLHSAQLVRSAELGSASSTHSGVDSYYGVRDRLMAEAVTAVVDDMKEARGPSVALWAHNGHVSGGSDSSPSVPMGRHLRERHGNAYYALGLFVGEGIFHARRKRMLRGLTAGPVENRLPPPPPTVLEYTLDNVDLGNSIIDFRDSHSAEPVANWLRRPTWTRSFGAIAPWSTRFAFTPMVPAEFDGVAYIRTGGTPTRL